ncbi:MAG TPA: DNA polymerase III subunit beta [Verrucomicrobiae bacterium]|nr:DNA polymerase III subunit beta [Verrucomicrobiae bacterium]
MKLTISKEQIIQGLQAVQNIVSTRTTLPVLSNVLLRAEGNRLELTATDLDVSISSAVEASAERAGAVTLPAKKLFGIVRELPAPQIELEVDDKNTCRIVAGASYFKINGLPAEEFPPFPKFAENRKINLPQDKLKSLMRKTSFAISTDESRFVLNGIFMSLKEHKVTLVATDGRRLALAEEEVDIPTGSEGECIVPSKAINELNRLLGTQGEVEIKFTDNQVSFTLQSAAGLATQIISKLIDGNYPNYRQVIPGEAKERITLGREELLQALRRAELMTSEKSNSVKLSFTKNKVEITANTPEVGEARESIALNYKGNDVAIAFNPIYMMDPLKALENDEVYLELIDELSPGVMKINGPFLYVLMPMRMS